MATVVEAPRNIRLSAIADEQRIALRGVSWETYQRLVEETGDDRHVLMAFNRGVLELTSQGLHHEDAKRHLDRLVESVTEELGISIKSYGSTTWKREQAKRGIEPDECYYFDPAKIAEAKIQKRAGKKDSSDYPAPDLAIEIDMCRSAVDRPEIYATLGVPEVWRFNGRELRIDRLGDDGVYHPSFESLFVPILPAEIVHWVLDDSDEDDNSWARRLRTWVREELAGRAR